MEWSNEYAVGIPAIDEQHRKLAILISNLEASAGNGQDRDRIHSDIVMLAKYNRAHLANEEMLMRAHDYPAADEHLSEHRQFIKALADLERQSAVRQVTTELVALIRAWEVEHVSVSDKDLAQHINLSGRDDSVQSGTDSMEFDRE